MDKENFLTDQIRECKTQALMEYQKAVRRKAYQKLSKEIYSFAKRENGDTDQVLVRAVWTLLASTGRDLRRVKGPYANVDPDDAEILMEMARDIKGLLEKYSKTPESKVPHGTKSYIPLRE